LWKGDISKGVIDEMYFLSNRYFFFDKACQKSGIKRRKENARFRMETSCQANALIHYVSKNASLPLARQSSIIPIQHPVQFLYSRMWW
jgi:hypothetical protein